MSKQDAEFSISLTFVQNGTTGRDVVNEYIANTVAEAIAALGDFELLVVDTEVKLPTADEPEGEVTQMRWCDEIGGYVQA